MVKYDAEAAKLISERTACHRISHNCCSAYFTLTQFENLQPMLYGMSHERRNVIKKMHASLFKTYQDRIMSAVNGTEYEEELREYIKEEDPNGVFSEHIDKMCGKQIHDVFMAIDSFNIEDMVTVAENFVDSQNQLENLRTSGRQPLSQTKELAVITQSEGLVWIKHSLFAV